MSGEVLLFQAACALLLYFIVRNRLVKLAHPIRMRLVETANRVLDDPQLPEASRRHVEGQLDLAYAGWIAWIFVVLTPVAAISALVDRIKGNTAAKRNISHRRQIDEIMWLSTLSVFMASPIAGLIFLLEILLLLIIFVPIGTVMRHLTLITEDLEKSWHSLEQRLAFFHRH